MKYTYYFFKILGLATFNYSEYSKSQSMTFTPSLFGILYNIFLCILIILLSIYSFTCDYTKITVIQFDNVLMTVRNVIEIIAATFVLLKYTLRQKKVTNILNQISSAANFLETYNGNKSYLNKIAFKNFFIIVIMWLFIFISLGFIRMSFMFQLLPSLICDLVISAMLIQYGIIVQTLRYLMMIIRQNFSNTLREISSKTCEYSRLSKFTYLRKLYLSILDLTEDVSDYYSQSMLICTSHIFIFLILNSYTIVSLFILEKQKPCPILFVHYVSKMLNYVVSMIILTKSVVDIRSEVNIKFVIITSFFIKLKLYCLF